MHDAESVSEKIRAKNPKIKIIKETFSDVHTPCLFVHTELGEWWKEPRLVLRNPRHPQESENVRKQKWMEQKEHIASKVRAARMDFSIEKKKEIVEKMISTSRDQNVYTLASDKRKSTCKARFGSENAMHHPDVVKKLVNSLQERTEAERRDKNEKTRSTIQRRFGQNWATKVDFIKRKISKGVKENYKNPEIANSIAEKRKSTSESRFGQGHYSQSEISKKRLRLAAIQRQEQEKTLFLPGWAEENGKSSSWFRVLKKQHGEAFAVEWIRDGKTAKTSLESAAELLFAVDLYNRQPRPGFARKPDFKLSDTHFIDVDGLYWHSELNLPRDYHYLKRLEYEKQGLRLFQFRENEIRNTPSIVQSIVMANLQKSRKVHGRKTSVQSVSQREADSFLTQNHMMGSIKAKHLGLYLGSELVMIFSYKKKKQTYDVSRLCAKAGTVVVGGFSKLFEQVKGLAKEWTYWVDLRYGSGAFLETQGWIHASDSLSWQWTDGKNTFNRLRCRANMDERKLSEKQHAEELGWYRIYDAGQRLYKINFN